MGNGRREIRGFLSYAHAHQKEADVFFEDFKTFTRNLPHTRLTAWNDKDIPLGEKWHEAIQREISRCDIAILLVSAVYMDPARYIREHEVERLFRLRETRNILIIPVYFAPCRFSDWPVFREHQIYKPQGKDYGFPHLDPDGFSYTDLVTFDYKDGVSILTENPNRHRYMLDFVAKLEERLQRIAASAKTSAQASLPPPPSYVPRKEKEHEVLECFRTGCRLVTIHADGGMGKTMLARGCEQKAMRESPSLFPDGTLFVSLEHIKGKTREAIAEKIGLSLSLPIESRTPEHVAAHLDDRRMLLILDNYETVAKSPDIREYIESLRHHCPHVRLLITSRFLTDMDGERTVDLNDGMKPREANALFTEEVKRHSAGWVPDAGEQRLIDRMLREIEFWPLAITWVAAWVKREEIREIASDLEQAMKKPKGLHQETDNPRKERHISREACLDWSLGLLEEEQRRMFLTLGLFPGSFTIEAASRVHDVPGENAQELLFALQDAALVFRKETKNAAGGRRESAPRETRFRMHAFVRDGAMKRLIKDKSKVSARCRRFVGYFTEQLERLSSLGRQGTGPRGDIDGDLDWLEHEWRNVFACAEYIFLLSNWEAYLRIADRLLRFLLLRGRMQDIERLYTVRLKRKSGRTSEAERKARGMMLNTLGVIYQFQKRWPEALEHFEQSLQFERGLLERARILNSMGAVYMEQDLPELKKKAPQCHEESRKACRQLLGEEEPGKAPRMPPEDDAMAWNVRIELATAMENLGLAYESLDDESLGDHESVDDLLRQSLQIREALKDHLGLAETYNSMGRIHQLRKNFAGAEHYFSRRRDILTKKGDRIGLARVLNSLGAVYIEMSKQGDDADERERLLNKAEQCFMEAREICHDANDMAELSQTDRNLAGLHMRRHHYADAIPIIEAMAQREKGRTKAELLNYLGWAHECANDLPAAISRYEAASEVCEDTDTPHEISTARINLGRAHLLADDPEQASRFFEDSLSGLPAAETAKALKRIGAIYEELGRYDQAWAYYARAIPYDEEKETDLALTET